MTRGLFVLALGLLALTLPLADNTAARQRQPTATPIAAADGLQLTPGQAVQGSITRRDQRDRFVVLGVSETRLTVGMFATADSGLIPRIELYAPNGDKLAQASAPTGAILTAYVVPVTGAYVIYASAERGAGNYTMHASYGWAVRDVTAGSAGIGTPLRGMLRRHGDRDVWLLDVPANVTVYLDVAAYQSALIPAVDLAASSGLILARAAGSASNRRATLTPSILQAGMYQVGISGVGNESIGGYVLIARLLPSNATATPGS